MTFRFSLVAVAGVFLGITAAIARPAIAEPIVVTSGSAGIAWDDPSGFSLAAPDDFVLNGFFTRVASSPRARASSAARPERSSTSAPSWVATPDSRSARA